MNILSIGGSGFVSGTLVQVARDAGHTVFAVSRGQRTLPEGVHPVIADRHDRPAFAAAIDNLDMAFDLVVDCIGYEPADAEQDIEIFAGKTKRFVFISTDFVFDPARRTYPQPAASSHYTTEGYGGKKRQCELRFHDAADRLPWTIIRPCHIYGPGSQLGCLPLNSRDVDLIAKLRRGETINLVGGGHFLQQPIFAPDLARMILSCHGNDKAVGQTYQAAGPDIIESRDYYDIIAEVLGVRATYQEMPVADHLAKHPGHAPFCCHRIYDVAPLHAAGLAAPATPIAEGLRLHVESLLSQ